MTGAAPRAIVFDWDNTLVASWEPIHHALVVTLEAMGHKPWSLAETKAKVRHSLRDAFPALFGDRWAEARKFYLDTFTATHLEKIKPMDGAEAMLAELQDAGFCLAVVSNKTGPVLRKEADHFGWTRYFRRLVGAGDATADKPDPAPLHLALDGSGIAAGSAVWYVGDTAIDMECAINSGCLGVLMGEADIADADFARFPPGLQFADCAAFSRHVKGL